MMQIAIISASAKQSAWVQSGFETYAKRLRGSCTLTLTEVALAKRGKGSSVSRALEQEGKRMLAAIPKGAHVVALDESGRAWNTGELADRLSAWLQGGRPVALLIGGPDGLAPDCFDRADERWSLSPLTLPHGLARVVAAEAIYRAWSLLEHHPYHRD
jgi:23S rRNA (pseudouridine1915-N3)-methyltransferase